MLCYVSSPIFFLASSIFPLSSFQLAGQLPVGGAGGHAVPQATQPEDGAQPESGWLDQHPEEEQQLLLVTHYDILS